MNLISILVRGKKENREGREGKPRTSTAGCLNAIFEPIKISHHSFLPSPRSSKRRDLILCQDSVRIENVDVLASRRQPRPL